MSRKPGLNLIGLPQHTIQRGNNREPCFYAEGNYCRYLNDIKAAADKNQCAVHAYVLMTQLKIMKKVLFKQLSINFKSLLVPIICFVHSWNILFSLVVI